MAALGSVVARVDKIASEGSVREPRWMRAEQEVGGRAEASWRSARERRGRVTKPDSRPEETEYSIHQDQSAQHCTSAGTKLS